MTSDSRSRVSQLALIFAALALLAVAALTLLRLSSFGIWDPWELSVADQARKLAEDRVAPDRSTPLPLRWIAAAFSTFGPREWAGRLPAVLSGLGLLTVGGLLVRRFAGARAALYAVIALGTTPFFLLHARLMLGSTPALLGAALVSLGAAAAVFPAASPARPEAPHAPYLWLALSGMGALLGAWSAGVMLTVLPALGAVAIVSLFVGPSTPQPRAREQARLVVIAAAALCAVMVVRAALRREADYSVWLGGSPLEGSVPTYERVLEQLFHSFAPWSALLPLALAALLRLDRARADQPLRLLCVAWSALAYVSQTVYLSSYGHAVFPAPLALTAAVALWLADGDEEAQGYWPQAIVGLLLLGLVIRDYALYPASPVGGLGLSDAKLPDTFNPKRVWSALFGVFALGLVVSSLAKRETSALDLRAPYRGIVRLFGTSPGHKAWLIVAALCGLACLGFGVVAFVPDIPLTTLGRRVGKVLLLVPIGLPIAVALGQIGVALSARLAPARHAVMLAAAIAIAAYASQVFLPKLSAQFSPRDVFDAYNKLAQPSEPLAQHQVESGAASYYVKGNVRELKARGQLLEYLSESGRRWAAVPSDQLADIDKAFRRKTGRHLFVPSADHARVSLVASQPVDGQPDHNPLARFVVKEAPKVDVSVGASFEDKIELIGYNLELPSKESVGAGQTFHITWVWRALQGNLGAYKSFVHVDAPNQRINGDHDPVDGKYPVRLWDEGDVIVDRQALHVPATYRPGRYVIYVGFYRGDSRLKVVRGAQDGENRVRAGTIEVR